LIVVDTSAIVAMILNEADARKYADALINDSAAPTISALNLYELRVVLNSRVGERGLSELATVVGRSEMTTAPFDTHQASLAFDAYRRFGKGNHPAGLNFGDCAAYALAKSLDAPLLFKGADFAKTDIRSAL
jgi:ribonuclease VapC